MAIVAPQTACRWSRRPLPDAVYQGVTRADLGDVRVFNAEGQPVPHAFCTAPAAAEPTITEQSLPVFELREARRERSGGSRIEVQTAGGTQVNVLEAGPRSAARGQRPHSHHRRARQRRSDARDPVRLAEPGRRVAGAGQHRGERRSGSMARARAGEHAVARDSRRPAAASASESSCRRRRTTICACSEPTAVRRWRSLA